MLVVDDSALVRDVLKTGSAAVPSVSPTTIGSKARDVVTLDLEWPRTDGLMFGRHPLGDRPLPIVVRSLADEPTVALDCLEAEPSAGTGGTRGPRRLRREPA